MPRYTLFTPISASPRTGATQPLTLAINDWQVRINAEPAGASEGKSYVLTGISHHAPLRTHVIKGSKGVVSNSIPARGWDPVAKKSIVSQSGSQWIPEVDDQVLVVFEHGDSASHAAVFMHPGPMARGSAQVQVDISAGAYRLRILRAGRASLSIAVATAADPQISRSVKWEVLC